MKRNRLFHSINLSGALQRPRAIVLPLKLAPARRYRLRTLTHQQTCGTALIYCSKPQPPFHFFIIFSISLCMQRFVFRYRQPPSYTLWNKSHLFAQSLSLFLNQQSQHTFPHVSAPIKLRMSASFFMRMHVWFQTITNSTNYVRILDDKWCALI